ncbi:hypothetical protein DFH09DRAFT_1339789 [Mycena vulgaris]|nr:hypothetical protein DFH09DRAFT_1339789 [Mycena vulgaris]
MSIYARRNRIRATASNTTIYDQVVATLKTMTSSLATQTFGETFSRKFDDDGKFGKYYSGSHKFTANIVAEVGSEAEGTWLAAYSKKWPANKLPLSDSSTPQRMLIAARCPTGATPELQDIYGDFLAAADYVREQDALEEEASGKHFNKVVEWLSRADGHPTEPADIMLLRLPPTYEKPRNVQQNVDASPSKGRARNKKSNAQADNVEMETAAPSAPAVHDRKIGDTYAPDMLPDHRGPYFAHEAAKLIQRDFRDENDNLIAPHELYSKLTEGTLFGAQISFETFVFHESNFSSKIYHIYVERLHIIDKGDGKAWSPPIPSLPSATTPSTPKKRTRDLEADNAVDNAFNSFKSISPPKKKSRTS